MIRLKIIQMLISQTGSIITPIASFIISSAITALSIWLGSKIPFLQSQMSNLNIPSVALGGSTLLTGYINLKLNQILVREAVEIQKIINSKGKSLELDGFAAAETQRALKEILGDAIEDNVGIPSDSAAPTTIVNTTVIQQGEH